jgi:hypothetical protein
VIVLCRVVCLVPAPARWWVLQRAVLPQALQSVRSVVLLSVLLPALAIWILATRFGAIMADAALMKSVAVIPRRTKA